MNERQRAPTLATTPGQNERQTSSARLPSEANGVPSGQLLATGPGMQLVAVAPWSPPPSSRAVSSELRGAVLREGSERPAETWRRPQPAALAPHLRREPQLPAVASSRGQGPASAPSATMTTQAAMAPVVNQVAAAIRLQRWWRGHHKAAASRRALAVARSNEVGNGRRRHLPWEEAIVGPSGRRSSGRPRRNAQLETDGSYRSSARPEPRRSEDFYRRAGGADGAEDGRRPFVAEHHAACRIQRAWKISRWRRKFLDFSEHEVGWVGTLDWLQQQNLLYGTELADPEDVRWWMQQRTGAPLDREVDPWGCSKLRDHLNKMWYGRIVEDPVEVPSKSQSDAYEALMPYEATAAQQPQSLPQQPPAQPQQQQSWGGEGGIGRGRPSQLAAVDTHGRQLAGVVTALRSPASQDRQVGLGLRGAAGSGAGATGGSGGSIAGAVVGATAVQSIAGSNALASTGTSASMGGSALPGSLVGSCKASSLSPRRLSAAMPWSEGAATADTGSKAVKGQALRPHSPVEVAMQRPQGQGTLPPARLSLSGASSAQRGVASMHRQSPSLGRPQSGSPPPSPLAPARRQRLVGWAAAASPAAAPASPTAVLASMGRR